ncbi:hypothetical protein [Streptomyces sp. SS8]
MITPPGGRAGLFAGIPRGRRMEELGCRGRYPDPDGLPPVPEWEQAPREGPCAVEGVELPARAKGPHHRRVTPDGDGPLRSCDIATDHSQEVRLTTVVHPGLAELFAQPSWWGSERLVTGGRSAVSGGGSLGGDLSVLRALCQTGRVAFVARPVDSPAEKRWARDLLPAYVEAEAERAGCGRIEVVRKPD